MPRPSSKHPAVKPKPGTPAHEERILVLQGGGALGAYQGGVFEALSEGATGIDWVAGISIGAINAALIAGNPAPKRLERLQEFWNLVSTPVAFSGVTGWGLPRETVNEANAAEVMLFGVPGFFTPRMPPAPLQPRATMEAISYYDTAPLRETLERLVDFDLINSGAVRLSVGSVNVRTGNFEYFDSTHRPIDARHIMASGALPPGFPPVEIDGEHYWDGGLVSNTPLQYVLDQPARCDRVVFQVDLFPAAGALPETMAEVAEREKDIRFSSRTRLNTSNAMALQAMAHAAQRLMARLPPPFKDDPDLKRLTHASSEQSVDVVHLIYRDKHYEGQSKDYEFSRASVRDHWAAGRADMAHTLHDPRWTDRHSGTGGTRIFDLAADRSLILRKNRSAN